MGSKENLYKPETFNMYRSDSKSSFDFTGVEPVQTKERGITYSPQQLTIFDWIKNGAGNGMIIAVAGAGKTTTLIEGLACMFGRVAMCAFNKRIADEIALKVEKRGLAGSVNVKTFHAYGFQAWRRRYPRVRVDADKSWNLIEQELPNMPKNFRTFAIKLVSMLKQSGIGYEFASDNGAEWDRIIYHHGLEDELTGRKPWEDEADYDEDELAAMLEAGKSWAGLLLNKCIEKSPEVIDFDDQLFMPMYAGMTLDQYDWVLVDEAQDTNAARLALARAMLKPGGRLLAVGDPRQAIYGFAGADSSSLTNIIERFACTKLNLTVSYRCPQAIVRVAQKWSTEIEAADDAPEGHYSTVEYEDFFGGIANLSHTEREGSVILCRNNKPIVGLAFQLIRQRIPCHVEGRDIGGQIKTLANKWKVNDLDILAERVREYRDREVQKLVSKRQQSKADVVSDRCETLLVLIDGILDENPTATKFDLNREIDAMFADNSNRGITLSSIHKSKGREWQTVYWLGRNAYQPSRFAAQEWQIEQEMHLMYVAATRSQMELIEVRVMEQRGMAA